MVFSNLVRRGFRFHQACFNKPLLIIQGKKGIIACKYIDIETANKAGDSVSLFSGVNSFDEMLESNVVECSENALLSGVKVGMKGEEVLKYIK